MKKNTNSRQHPWRNIALGALLVGGASLTQSCKDDVLEGQPEWLGNSIYERLAEEGNYSTMMRLIDDLGQHDVLSQTGSKTLFAADDNAFQAWYGNNNWGVSKYEELTTAQKKLLLNNSMVNNAYLIELLSNVSGDPPEEGLCMRRTTAVSIYDSVPTMKPAQMPMTPIWDKYRSRTGGIHLLQDNTAAPMIHFLPAFMRHNKITDNDLTILTNGEANTTAESYVNGKKVTEKDITCKNGYIQKVEGVIESSPNMAEILRQHEETSMWSQLIDRFAAPYYNQEASNQYQRLYGTDKTDSVYVMRYYATVGTCPRVMNVATGKVRAIDPDGNYVGSDEMLAFDPGWNQYMYVNSMGYDLHYDAAAMIVPTNEALSEWWNNGGGRVVKDEYGTWDNVPQLVVAELLNNNMKDVFSETVPSKFDNILNDAKVQMGIEPKDVVKCYMGCNGVVYVVNKVFAPASYSSVSFPAMINQSTMNTIYWGISNLDFAPYLNSMDSYYSLILPTNNSMLTYVDPVTYGSTQPQMLEFYYDSELKEVKADSYYCTIGDDGTVTKGELQQTNVSSNIVRNRLQDMLNNLIIVGNVEDGHSFYKTKGGNIIRVENAGQEGTMTLQGGWQLEKNRATTVAQIYDQSGNGGNGKTYVVDGQMPMTAEHSVYQTLRETTIGDDAPYSAFFNLITGGDSVKYNLMINQLDNKYSNANSADNFNCALFTNYNYTVFVPNNDAIQSMIDQGYLPTWEDYEVQDSILNDDNSTKAQQDSAALNKVMIRERIYNFLKYHIQDNAILIGSSPEKDADGNLLDNVYETAMVNPDTKRFYTLNLNFNNSSMTVKDVSGNTRNVVTSNPELFNRICREYWFKNETGTQKTIYMTSSAVVHQIDGVLLYDAAKQLTPWRNELKSTD